MKNAVSVSHLFFFPILALSANIARAESNFPGCEQLREYRALAKIETQDQSAATELDLTYRTLCRFPSSPGSTVRYPNGKIATYNAETVGATWYYSNGNILTYNAGNQGATWYYSTGRVLTYNAGQTGATHYYSNGQVATYSYRTNGATWYYDNGRVITYSAGSRGATWYYENGRTLSYSFGTPGATWYNRDGSTWTNSGPELSDAELLNVPRAIFNLSDEL